MPSRRSLILSLTLVLLLFLAAPAAAQETRGFSGSFFAEVGGYEFEDPVYYVWFGGGGSSDLFGDFEVLYGQYTFDGSTFRVTDGFLAFSTPEGEVWIAFEGEGVFTGFFGGWMYIVGGTGIYENATGSGEIAAQFWRRDFTVGDATFHFVGEITY